MCISTSLNYADIAIYTHAHVLLSEKSNSVQFASINVLTTCMHVYTVKHHNKDCVHAQAWPCADLQFPPFIVVVLINACRIAYWPIRNY